MWKSMRQNVVSAAFENKQVYRGYRFPLNYCSDLWEKNEMIFLRAVAHPTLLLCRKHSRSENEQGVMRPQVGKRVWKMACADLMWDQEWGGIPRTRIIRETPPPLHLTFDKSKVAYKDTPVFWMPNDSSC